MWSKAASEPWYDADWSAYGGRAYSNGNGKATLIGDPDKKSGSFEGVYKMSADTVQGINVWDRDENDRFIFYLNGHWTFTYSSYRTALIDGGSHDFSPQHATSHISTYRKHLPTFRCADEGGRCPCSGTVFYGRKFDGKYSGNVLTFSEMIKFPHKKIRSSGSISCSNGEIGDASPGFVKTCFCVQEISPLVCAERQNQMCKCKGAATATKIAPFSSSTFQPAMTNR